MTPEEFEKIIEETIENLPDEIKQKLDNVVFIVQDYPDAEELKRQFGEQIEYDALDDIVNDVYQNLVRDKKIEVIGTPELVDVDYKLIIFPRF